MKVGIYFTATKFDGGVYQYSIALLESLLKIKRNEYLIISTSKDIPEKFIKAENFKIIDISFKCSEWVFRIRDTVSYIAAYVFPKLIGIVYKLGFFGYLTSLYKFSQENIICLFEKEKVDLIFYPTSSDLSFLIEIPSVVTVHDLQHRLNPKFKEVSVCGRWENREYRYQNVSRSAYRIFVDSAVGKDDMIRFYPNSQGKVVILSYLAPSYIAPNVTKSKTCHVKRKYSLPDDYIFYPAKFWPHKNHKNLINALGILKEHGKRVNLVLTGSKNADFSSFYEVMGLVEEKDLKDQVFYLGFVNNEELSAIYKMAKAMIMPTFFGPTNIPILEAWVMGTPVITSDIRGCRDQLGDAGLLVDPKSSTDMAKKVWKIYNDGELRKTLIERGKIRVNRWTFEDFSKRIAMVLKDFETQKNASSKNN